MGKKRGKAAELTGRSMSSSVGSGATGARQSMNGVRQVPRLKTARWQRCRASGEAWLGGDGEGVAAELLDMSERRGGGSGGNYGERRRGSRSAITREGEGDEGESEGGREWDVGVGVASLDVSSASVEAGGGRRVAAGTGHALLVLLAGGGG